MPPAKKKPALRGVHAVKLSDFRAKKENEGAIDLDIGDGDIIRIPPPELWADEITQLSEADDTVAVAKALIGDRYDEFVEAGGNAVLLMSIIGDAHGVELGES